MLVFLHLLVQLAQSHQFVYWCFHVSCINILVQLCQLHLKYWCKHMDIIGKVLVLWIEWCCSFSSTYNSPYIYVYHVWVYSFGAFLHIYNSFIWKVRINKFPYGLEPVFSERAGLHKKFVPLVGFTQVHNGNKKGEVRRTVSSTSPIRLNIAYSICWSGVETETYN
jgi:hypothetical protein